MPVQRPERRLVHLRSWLPHLPGLAVVALCTWPLSVRWPFAVAWVDLYLGFGLLNLQYKFFSVVVSSIFYLGILAVLHGLPLRWLTADYRAALFRTLVALSLSLSFSLFYPLFRDTIQMTSYLHTPGSVSIFLVQRAADESTRSVVWTTSRDLEWTNLPSTWPFESLSPGTTQIVHLAEERQEEITSALRDSHFFGLPETLDPRPRQDHVDYSVAVLKGNHIWRSSARLSDPSFEHFDKVVHALSQRLRSQ